MKLNITNGHFLTIFFFKLYKINYFFYQRKNRTTIDSKLVSVPYMIFSTYMTISSQVLIIIIL